MVIMLVQMHVYLTHLIFNRPTVCIIAHKNLDFSAFEKKNHTSFLQVGLPCIQKVLEMNVSLSVQMML